MAPWDNAADPRLDVVKNGSVLFALVVAGWLASTWLGTPCQSNTWARSPELRDWAHPEGKPNLSTREQNLVLMGNMLAYWSVWFALTVYQHGGYFAIENPVRSWLWVLRDTMRLWLCDGVEFTVFNFGPWDVYT